jgi:hypothetical protein
VKSRPLVRQQRHGGKLKWQAQAPHRLAAETGRRSWFASQNYAFAIVVRQGLVRVQAPAIALPGALAGAASEAVWSAGGVASSLGLRLTRRSSGPPTAWRPGREAVLFIIVLAARAPRCRRPLNLYVRRCPTQSANACLNSHLAVRQRPRVVAHRAPNPSAPRSGCGDREAPVERHPELRVRHRGPARPRPRSTSGHRPSWCAGRRGFGGGVVRGQCGFVVGAAPNSAFKRTANSVAPWPRGRAVYHRPRGQGTTLPAAA